MPSTYQMGSNENYIVQILSGRDWLGYEQYSIPNYTVSNSKIYASERNIHTYSVMFHTALGESIITASTIPLTIPAVLM